MNQQSLSSAGFAGGYGLPPETDSSGEVVAYAAGSNAQTSNSNPVILPEITLGSPSKRPDPAGSGVYRPSSNPQPEPALKATQTIQPTISLETPPPPVMPVMITGQTAATPPAAEYWQTVVVAPTETKKMPEKTVTALPTLGGGQVIEEEEAVPNRIKFFSWISFSLAMVYGLSALALTYTAYLLNSSIVSLVKTALTGEFSKTYPEFAIMPLVFCGLSIIYTYLGFRLAQGSRRAWAAGVIGMGLGTLVIIGLGQTGLTPLELILSNTQIIAQEPILRSINREWLKWLVAANWAVLAIAGGLLIFYKSFKYPAHKLDLSQKLIWLCLSAGLLFVVGGYFATAWFTNLDADHGYDETVKTAGFHVYRPKALPAGWVQTSMMAVNEAPGSVIVGRDDFVETYFDRSLSSRIQGQPSAQIILRQVDVPAGFDLQAFAQSLVEPPMSVREVPITRADGQIGYAVEKQAESHAIRAVTLRTSDNVLILLSSRGAQIEDMIALANTLD